MNFVVENEKDLGDKVWAQVKDRLVAGFKCALIGDLGAGKTALVKEIAAKLGVKEHVTSPTFNLCKEYKISDRLKLQHIDLYRHQGIVADNAEVAEWINDQNTISFVEWPEKSSIDLSIYNLIITIEVLEGSKRRVNLKWN